MDLENHHKVINTLRKLLDPNIAQTINEKHLSCLLKYLSGQEEDLGAVGNPRLDETDYLPWIKQAVDQWKNSDAVIPKHVLTFITELTAAMCTNEQIFVKLNFTQVLDEFIEILRSLRDPSTTDRIKLSYIKLISSFLYHQSGKQWIMVTNYWFDIFSMITSNNGTGEVAKESCNFIVLLIEKSLESNEIFCRNIIETILIPLRDLSVIYSENPSTDIDDLAVVLIPLKIILEDLLVSASKRNDTTVILLIRDNFNLEQNLRDLVSIVNHPGSNVELVRILTLVLAITSVDTLVHFHYSSYDSKKNAGVLLRMFMDVIYYHGIIKAVDIMYCHQITFEKILKNLHNAELALASNLYGTYQMLMFIVYPVQKIAASILEDQLNEHDEIRMQLTNKIIKYLLPTTMEAYSHLNNYPINLTVQDATLSLKYLVSCSQFYSHKIANTATQIIIYVLVDILNALKVKPDVVTLTLPHEFFVSLLDTIAIMLRNFELDFKDNMETTYLTEITSKFLNIYPWPPKVVVKALQLLDVGISRSLSPNMTFLIDLADVDVDYKKIILSKLCDTNWEVKNASIRVVTSICLKAKKKFDTYRELVLDADFPTLILKIASTDTEVAVLVSAIRCLQEMVKIREFWNRLSENRNVYEEFLKIYSLQPEGIVRSEAVVLLKDIYEIHHLPENILEKMYENMFHAVMEDQHCMVKVKGIEFWHQVIERHLHHEGMLDGIFPTTTFSMSLKKIITFDDQEIKNCLTRVVDRLNDINCLKIFLYGIRCDTNEELKNTALKLIKKFMELLKRYMFRDFPSSIDGSHRPKPNTLSIEHIIRHNVMNTSAAVVSPDFDDFCEDVLDLEEISNSVPSPASVLSNTSSDKVKPSNKYEFLTLAFHFENFLSNEVRKKEEQKEDFSSVLHHILNL